MYVVGHHAPGKEAVTFMVKVTHGIGHFFGDDRIAKGAGACALIQETLNGWCGEALDFSSLVGREVTLKFLRSLDDVMALKFDLIENGFGQRVS
jgi:hypothetical protein